MKHAILILLISLLPFGAAAQRQKVVVGTDDILFIASEEAMRNVGGRFNGQNQGFALMKRYRKQAVVLRSGGQLLIFDLHKRQITKAFQLKETTSHCNNASATIDGRMWVSECYGERRCLVYDMSDEGPVFVRSISYNGPEHWFAQDWIVDEEAHRIYAYGGNKGESLWIKAFDLEKALSGERVEYSADEVLQSTEIKGVALPQGSLVRGGRAYLLDGDQPGETFLHVYDLASGNRLLKMPVGGEGLEPEGLDMRGRRIYVSFAGPGRKGLTIMSYKRPKL